MVLDDLSGIIHSIRQIVAHQSTVWGAIVRRDLGEQHAQWDVTADKSLEVVGRIAESGVQDLLRQPAHTFLVIAALGGKLKGSHDAPHDFGHRVIQPFAMQL